jgi:hypothetical protein
MSTRRLASTVLAMAAVGMLLRALGPDVATVREAVLSPQRLADTAGPDVLVLAWAGALAWLVWCWGLLGLLLTVTSTVPGLIGALARSLSRVVLPAAARRTAAVALGIGLGAGLAAPGLAGAAPAVPVPVAAPDWPPATPAPAPAPTPDWPAETTGEHVVVRGDCLWDIAAGRLTSATGRTPTDREVTVAVQAWWTANAAVIGPDPDLLLPGQVLRPPGA